MKKSLITLSLLLAIPYIVQASSNNQEQEIIKFLITEYNRCMQKVRNDNDTLNAYISRCQHEQRAEKLALIEMENCKNILLALPSSKTKQQKLEDDVLILQEKVRQLESRLNR